MTDCGGDVPWPADLDTDNPPDDPDPTACPPEYGMRLTMSWAEAPLAASDTVVTRLRPADDAPLVVRDCDGSIASVGDLKLDVELDKTLGDDQDAEGHTVVKGVADNKYLLGPVVEGLTAGGAVQLESDETLTLPGGGTLYRGRVEVSVPDTLLGHELAPVVVRVDGAEQRFDLGIPSYGFPTGRVAALRLQFAVPTTGLPDPPVLALKLWLRGSATGTLPTMLASYRVLSAPGDGEVAAPVADTDLTLTTALAITGGSYRQIVSPAIEVTPGAVVLVSLWRELDDGYGGEVTALRLGGLLDAQDG